MIRCHHISFIAIDKLYTYNSLRKSPDTVQPCSNMSTRKGEGVVTMRRGRMKLDGKMCVDVVNYKVRKSFLAIHGNYRT